MGRWIRVDALVHDHPKMVRAGFWGFTVIQAAWRMSKAHDMGGDIPPMFWDPVMLCRWSLAGPEHEAEIQGGMEACERAGLVTTVTRDNRDVTTIHDWDRYQRDATASERQRRHRARKKSDVTTRNPVPVTRDNRDVTAVTPTGHDKTSHSQIRMIREREIESISSTYLDGENDSTPLPPIGDRIYQEYIRQYGEARGGAWPGHSATKWTQHASKIQTQAAALIRAGGGEVTDEGILRMVQRFLPLHFASQDKVVIESDYTLGMFAARWNRYADQWSEMR